LDQLVQQISRQEAYQATLETEQALTQCSGLVTALNARLGEAAPSMEGLSQALSDCAGLAQHILALKGGPPTDDIESAAADAVAAEGNANVAAVASEEGRMASTNDIQRAVLARSDVYRRLSEVGEQLRILEPHSPVPFLVRKAIAWGNLPFPELLRTLAREEGLMSMLSREDDESATDSGVHEDA
jgi:type VI secretion system protein ImpA